MDNKNNNGSRIRFEIQELGPIGDSVVEFKPFMLFSGDSNTGKSYTAMAVYYFFYMLKDINTMRKLAKKLFDLETIENQLKAKGHIEVSIPQSLGKEFEQRYNETISRFMGYMLGYDDFKCSVNLELNTERLENAKIETKHIKDIKNAPFFEFSYETLNLTGSHLSASDDEFQDDFSHILKRVFLKCILGQSSRGSQSFKRFFLPPARGAFSGLTLSSLKEISSIGMYKEYLEGMDSIRYENFRSSEDLEGQKDVITALFNRLMDGKINSKRDNVSITVGNSQTEIPLSAGSSAIKELYPLYQVLNRVSIDDLSLCIEEPEAHLHPDLQRSVAKLLAYMVNKGALVQATTHSDFFLNQINNLVKLHYIGEKNQEKLIKILEETGIEKESILSPEKIGAYYFKKTGKGVIAEKLEASPQGLPLESFEQTYDESIKETRYLSEALDEDDEQRLRE